MVFIKWTNQAVKDLRNIYDYISQDSEYFAKRQVAKLKIRTTSLKQFPEIGRIVPELAVPEVRELIEGHYRIVYRIVNEDAIDILTIHHTSKADLSI